MKKTGSEQDSPAEPLERARLQADVAKQRVRIAKEELKRARKRLKEAKREARRLRARKAWKRDRKSTRLNSSHPSISYAVFCLKKKKNKQGKKNKHDKRRES